ncbi:MAG: LysE family translocator, partial [Rhodobacterales bacterium]|nr:LysE family translocator [Rhodobacterales bacterium]
CCSEFPLASAAVVLIPGPNVILTISCALKQHRNSCAATVAGISAGAFVAMSVSLAGAGAIVMASATLFSILKIIGAGYLLWLAYKLWTAPFGDMEWAQETMVSRNKSAFGQAFLISALNPKGPVFHMAFVPQFITIGHPLFAQFAILVLTFVAVATANSLLWLFLARVSPSSWTAKNPHCG